MMLRHLGWNEAAHLIEVGLQRSIARKTVTYDFGPPDDGAPNALGCRAFGQAIVGHMGA